MLRLSWNLTAAELVLSCTGWGGLWGEALFGLHLVPLYWLAAQFFIGLGLGAYGQRCKSRRRATPLARTAVVAAKVRAYREENFAPPHLTNEGLAVRGEASSR